MEDSKPAFNFNIPESILQMDKEIEEEDKRIADENIKEIKDRNTKARMIIQRFSKPMECELDGIVFTLKPITVGSWDTAEGNREDPSFHSHIVRDSLMSPELSDEEFGLLPAGLKYKLFMFLLQDFFLIAGKVKKKN